MKLAKRLSIALAFVLAASQLSDAKVRLPQVISNCMVLQRDTELNIWGWADPGEKVTVRFDGNHFFTEADAQGNWAVKMPAHKAGGPYLLEVNEIILRDVLVGDLWLLSGQSNQETPIERLTDKYPEINVSNNHMIRLYKVPTQDTPGVLDEDILPGERWHSAVASDVMNWKALAYFYAVEAYEKTGIPQGMLVSSLGGSMIEKWISEEYLMQVPEQAAQKEAADRQAAAQLDLGQVGGWEKESFDDSDWATVQEPAYLADSGIGKGVVWFRKTVDIPTSMAGRHAKIRMGRMVDGDEVYVNGVLVGATSYFGPPRKYDIPAGVLHEGKNVVAVRLTANGNDAGFVPDKPYSITGDEAVVDLTGTWKYKVGRAAQAQRPGAGFGGPRMGGFTGAGLYNGMIWPLRNINIAGVIWYQGESNAGMFSRYENLLTKMIENWRELFGRPELPFMICQLPNYMDKYDQPTDSDWARIREAQRNVSRNVPNTALAVSYDTGEYNDIHPLNKKDMAKRLYTAARAIYYGDKIVSEGPAYESMKVDGSKIILSFSNVGGGLKAREGQLRHFAIAGADRKFVWANATIKGSTIIVSSPEVKEPVAVRYAWADNPDDANLINKEGLLASPFRTDDWEYTPKVGRLDVTD